MKKKTRLFNLLVMHYFISKRMQSAFTEYRRYSQHRRRTNCGSFAKRHASFGYCYTELHPPSRPSNADAHLLARYNKYPACHCNHKLQCCAIHHRCDHSRWYAYGSQPGFQQKMAH